MSVHVSDVNVANKWVPFFSVVLFDDTLSKTKHQRKKSPTQTQSLTVNRLKDREHYTKLYIYYESLH